MARRKSDKPAKAPKAPKAPKDPNAPKAVRKAWAVRQLERVARILKGSDKLAKRFTKTGAPGELGATMTRVVADLQTVAETLAGNAEFKPTVRLAGKAGIGDVIALGEAAKDATIFKSGLVDPALYAGAKIVADDRVYWLVRCTDDQVRAIAKKLVTIAS